MDYDNIVNNQYFCHYSRLFLYNMNGIVNEYLSKDPFLSNIDKDSSSVFKINEILSRISMKKGFGAPIDTLDCNILNDSFVLLNEAKNKDCFHIKIDPIKKETQIEIEENANPVSNTNERFKNYIIENQQNVDSYVDLQLDLAKNFKNVLCPPIEILQVKHHAKKMR